LTAGAIDIGFGSGPGMGYASKGVPAHAVAVMANPPRNMCLVVPKGGPVKTIADLRGKKIGVSTAGSLTDWLVRAISAREGWGPDGIETVPMGEVRTRAVAMKAGELQGSVTAIEEGYDYKAQGGGDILMNFGEIAPDFHTHVIFATDALIKNNPALLRRFLHGWFKAVAYIRDHRAEAVRVIAKATNYPDKIVDDSYDTEMSMISFDGAFSPKAVDAIRASLKDLGITDTVPPASAMYNPDFAPVKL
jgi:ABC-type nitrate/sulfonate/bicarbonate transport system substrate-binding protein